MKIQAERFLRALNKTVAIAVASEGRRDLHVLKPVLAVSTMELWRCLAETRWNKVTIIHKCSITIAWQRRQIPYFTAANHAPYSQHRIQIVIATTRLEGSMNAFASVTVPRSQGILSHRPRPPARTARYYAQPSHSSARFVLVPEHALWCRWPRLS